MASSFAGRSPDPIGPALAATCVSDRRPEQVAAAREPTGAACKFASARASRRWCALAHRLPGRASCPAAPVEGAARARGGGQLAGGEICSESCLLVAAVGATSGAHIEIYDDDLRPTGSGTAPTFVARAPAQA